MSLSTCLSLIIFTTSICTCIYSFFGGTIVFNENITIDLIYKCYYLWLFNCTAVILSIIQSLYSIYILLFTVIMPIESKKKCIVFFLLKTLLILSIGTYIILNIDDGCKNDYIKNHLELWNFFIVSYIYSIIIWTVFIFFSMICCLHCLCKSSEDNDSDYNEV